MTTVPTAMARRSALRTDLLAQYEAMVEIRYFEDRVTDLFAQGLVHGTTHTCQGQEAIAVGIAASIEPTDQVVCTYRGHGIALALGATPSGVLGEIMGRTSGMIGGVGGSMHLSEPSVGLLPTMAIVGAGIPIAVGAALSATILGTGAIAVAVFGDGATNIGAFHEGLNLASIWRLPVLFICENNLYGEYTRIDRSTPVLDIASRADSYGIPGTIVDGQDAALVVDAVTAAAAEARNGGGPHLLEFKTYRYSGHSRADTGPYRPDGELELWKERDPIEILSQRLIEEGIASLSDLEGILSTVHQAIDSVISETLETPFPPSDAMLRNVFPTVT